MKMKKLISVMFCLAFYVVGNSQSIRITGRVIDKNMTPIANACIMVYSQDSTLVSSGFSDSSGEFSIYADSASSRKMRVSCLGFETVWKSLPTEGDIELTEDSRLLSEVVVKGKKTFTRQTSTGFLYDLSGIEFIKGQNLFEALRLVPFIDINREGEISVNGGKRYALYLNGKPFDIAMSNPIQILQSIQAKNVKKIEVVMEPDFRFSNSIPVINIITSPHSLDGVYVNGSVKYETNPNANAGASFLAKKERVNFSFSYIYDYKGQNDQPIYQSVTAKDHATVLNGDGDGDWHTHVLRALASWHVDSLNVVYADVHAQINNDDYKTEWTDQNGSLEKNRNSATKGTLEANMIYRNYFRHNSGQEHFMAGYRYTYNPDKRNYAMTDPSGNPEPLSQKTDGGLHEHTLNLQAIMPVSPRHQLSVGARTIYRKADVNSTDGSGLSYTQSITYPYIDYIGSFKWFNAAVSLSCEYEHLSMDDTQGSRASSTSDDFYFLPSVNLYRSFGSWMTNIIYGRSLQRPSIVMLNPFYSSVNNYFHEIGNPDLKAETNDAVTLGASFFKRQVSLSLGLSYSHTDDAILQYQKELSESGEVISSYGNIGKRNTLTGNVFVNWQPVSSLVLKLNVNGGAL